MSFSAELVAGKADLGVALVTGASTGIGRATAKALKDAGFRVFGTSRRAVSENPDGITMLIGDVTDDASVTKLVDEVLANAGRIDLLVNNAGVGLLGGAEESSIAQAQALFDVNLFGVLRVTNAVLPTMRRQASGRIINMSSVMGLIPAPYLALYSSTRHALEGYSESLDHELRAFRRIAPPRGCGSRSLQHSLGDDFGDIAYLLHRLTHDRFRPGARQIIDIKQPIRRREIVLE